MNTMEAGKKAKLVNISQYAEKWQITRDAVYNRIRGYTINQKGEKISTDITLTVYEVDGKPYLNIDEDPQVRPYTKDDIV